MSANTITVSAGAVAAFLALNSWAQCTKDIECRGDRICEKGICVYPPPKPSSGHAPSSPAPTKATSSLPTFNDYRVEYTNKSFSLGHQGPSKPNFAGHYLIVIESCGTGCSIPSLFDLLTKKEYSLPFGGEQETKRGDNYTTYLEFEKDSSLLRVIYNISLKSSGKACRQQFFSFRDGKLSLISQAVPVKHDFCDS